MLISGPLGPRGCNVSTFNLPEWTSLPYAMSLVGNTIRNTPIVMSMHLLFDYVRTS